jgi:SAM-dependent methyltransferase
MTEPSYTALARIYDAVNGDLDYAAWGDYVERCFDRYLPSRPTLVLDLACGTGRMTGELYRRGYDLIGVDQSAEMLAAAVRRTDDLRFAMEDEWLAAHPDRTVEDLPDFGSVLYLQQDMRDFELYGTVGAIVCCLDSVNYLTEPEDLLRCLRWVRNYLDPGGLFLFDVNTPYKFREVYGDNAYAFDEEVEGRSLFCSWQNAYDPESRTCAFYLTLFEEGEDGRYDRAEEAHLERCYDLDELRALLSEAGLELLDVHGSVDGLSPTPTTERWHLVARRPEE